MTNQEWLQGDDPKPMIEFLLKKSSRKKRSRKMRLAAVAACRNLFFDSLTDERSRQALEVAERFADDHATDAERRAAWKNANAATEVLQDVYHTTRAADDRDAEWRFYVGEAAQAAVSEQPEEALSQLAGLEGYEFLVANILRDVFGPMARLSFNPAWLSPSAAALAKTIYDERRFDAMPILADALEEAGCTDAVLLEHCRHTTPYGVPEHARGCWVLDLLLGKS